MGKKARPKARKSDAKRAVKDLSVRDAKQVKGGFVATGEHFKKVVITTL
jgi:hypothetical protein